MNIKSVKELGVGDMIERFGEAWIVSECVQHHSPSGKDADFVSLWLRPIGRRTASLYFAVRWRDKRLRDWFKDAVLVETHKQAAFPLSDLRVIR